MAATTLIPKGLAECNREFNARKSRDFVPQSAKSLPHAGRRRCTPRIAIKPRTLRMLSASRAGVSPNRLQFGRRGGCCVQAHHPGIPRPPSAHQGAARDRVRWVWRNLVADMFETMYAAPGIGLAATQVNVHRQLLVLDVSEGEERR